MRFAGIQAVYEQVEEPVSSNLPRDGLLVSSRGWIAVWGWMGKGDLRNIGQSSYEYHRAAGSHLIPLHGTYTYSLATGTVCRYLETRFGHYAGQAAEESGADRLLDGVASALLYSSVTECCSWTLEATLWTLCARPGSSSGHLGYHQK